MLLDAGVRFKVTQEQRAVIRTLDRPDENLRQPPLQSFARIYLKRIKVNKILDFFYPFF
jgi:hypothetical protein